MTAYTPKHAATQPRTWRPSLYRRVRRLLLSLLPARKIAVPLAGPRFACCGHCTDGCPCEPQDNHLAPCADGCNDVPDGIISFDGVLSERMLAEVRAQWNEVAARTPVWAVRRDGLVTVTAAGEVEVYPAPLAWEASGEPTAAQPALDEEAAELAHAEYIRERLPVFNEVPQLEVLKRTAAALRNLDAGERLAKWLIA